MLQSLRQAGAAEGAAAPADCSKEKAPMREVAGKVAFITGGSSGIGLGIARAFATAGMKVAIGYRTREHIRVAMELFGNMASQVHAISVDVTDRPGMEKAAAEVARVFGKIHVLVNNAGVVHHVPLSQTSYEDWDWVINVNLNGVFNGLQAFLPYIQKHREGGQIIATASMDGLVAEPWHNPSYTASKFAVVGMMEGLRATLAESNIGVSTYCPGAVKTQIADSDRNRPGGRRNAARAQSLGKELSSKEDKLQSELFMDPFTAGELVLRGMRSNDLYILTHPEYEPIVRDRNEALLAAFPKDLQASSAQVERLRSWRQESVYRKERDRISCTRVKRAKSTK
ncbi:SDR family oxidoreductase [Steroidobacter gossypii]|nr:SDR family NAD(P)-dependent oxidoreductase [Steroidobacter gossypii]